jgi:putative ABC transport system permease protein
MRTRGLLLRWSWRDLRKRWLMVMAISMIIAIGIGVYAGFSSMSTWRQESYDLNYARMNMYDLRVRLSPGTYTEAGTLRAVVSGVAEPGAVAQAEERLLVPIQVDASTNTEEILVHGELVGVDVTGGGPLVNQLHVAEGRPLEPGDSGRNVAVLHSGFISARGLPAAGTIRVGGGAPLEYVGRGLTPDYFVITARTAGHVPVGNLPHYAVVFTSLETAQTIAGRTGMVNDVVLTLAPGADRAAAKRALEAVLRERLPDVSATVLTTEEDEAHRILYDDIEGDQRMVSVLAMLVFGGAALAAFNLASRLVESQRREIGVGMALGVQPRQLAIRPLLFGAQVAVLGVLGGIPVGLLVAQAFIPILLEAVPLPEWRTAIPLVIFGQAAALGFILPFLATAYPVLRAVRVQPVDAIRSGYLAGRSGGLAPLLRRIPLPGRSVAQMPPRNLLRTPRRTLLTALAIGAAVTALVAIVGLLDTFNQAIDQGIAETTHTAPDRVEVQLDFFYPRDAEPVHSVTSSPAVGRADFGLRIEGITEPGAGEVPLVIDLLDFQQAMWTPTLTSVALEPAGGGIVLAQKAASDLGVQPGDTVTLRHPRREGLGYRMVDTEVIVAALHPGPLRFHAYMDLRSASIFGFVGIVNYAQVQPAPGSSGADVRRALFGTPGVALAQPVSETGDQLRDMMSQISSVLLIAQVAALAITLLIGFNATSISTDERARDHATMFAFGLPVLSVLRINVVESALIGLLGILIGIPAGFVVVDRMVATTVAETMPELLLQPVLSPLTISMAFVVGVVAVAAGPLFTIRKLWRTDIPATLRVIE